MALVAPTANAALEIPKAIAGSGTSKVWSSSVDAGVASTGAELGAGIEVGASPTVGAALDDGGVVSAVLGAGAAVLGLSLIHI